MANILNKKVQCYQQYGLTSYLASCSASLLTRKTYLATTVKSNIYVTDIKEPIIQVGNLASTRTFQDARDAVRAYFLLLKASEESRIDCGEYFNIAGEEIFKLPEVIDILLSW